MEEIHKPVMLKEVLEIFDPQIGGRYIDATVNGGGHAKEILDRVGETGALLGIDRDIDLADRLKKKFPEYKNLLVACSSYAQMDELADTYGFRSANGILFDLGFSSYHVDQSGRGFSFLRDEPLDMRYNTEKDRLTATTIVNTWSQAELARIITEYGEERFAKRIAAGITDARKRKPIRSTFDLVAVIRHAVPRPAHFGKIHIATRTFQALRIAVNNELGEIAMGLEKGIDLLTEHGKMIVISFHSLEDRAVKQVFRAKEKEGIVQLLNKKPLVASSEEIRLNPRSRSAKLRAIVKR